MHWTDRAVRRFQKQALGSSPAGAGGSATSVAPAPKMPTATPKAPGTTGAATGSSAPPLGGVGGGLPRPPAVPKPVPPPTPAAPPPVRTQAPQSQAGADMTNQLRSQFRADPRSYMQQANRSGAMGGLLAAGGMIHSDAMKTILGGEDAPAPGSGDGFLAGLGRDGMLSAGLGLLGKIPGVASTVSKIPGAGLAGGLLGVGGRAMPAVSGALNLGWAPMQAAGDLYHGDYEAAGRRFHDPAYNRSLGDSSRSYLGRTWEAMHPENGYKNLTSFLGGLTDGATYRGFGTQMLNAVGLGD